MVVGSDAKSDAVPAAQNVISRNLPLDAIDSLINVGLEETQLRLRRERKCQIPIRGDANSMDAFEFDPDPAGIGVR